MWSLALARDLEEIVAAPILEYSPLLSDTDLMEIIAAGKVQEVLTAIARRKPLSDKVSDALVQSLDVSAVAALLVNPDAKIRKETLEQIVEEAEKIRELACAAGAARRSFAARAIRRIASFVGAALIERLSSAPRLERGNAAPISPAS